MTTASDAVIPGAPRIESASRMAAVFWFGGIAAALAALLIPISGDSAMQLARGLDGYPAEVVRRSYQLIRVATPWIPVGMLLSWAMPFTLFRLISVLGVLACMMLAGLLGSGVDWSVLRDILFVLPGIAAGGWIGHASMQSAFMQGMLPRPEKQPTPQVAGREQTRIPTALATPATERIEQAVIRPGHRGSQARAARLAGWAASAALTVFAAWAVTGFPFGRVAIALGLAIYAAVLWWQPLAWLIAVPAALPLLDLAPWTGRFFLDEFDVLLVVTLAVLLLKGPSGSRLPHARGSTALITAFLIASGIAALAGLLPLAPVDANAFSSYWSPYNALRVGKGILWGGVICFLIAHTGAGETTIARLFASGMAIGLLGVGLVGVWERWLYAGLGDEASTYRIVSTFSSMHTGGGHIEAYLVAAVPFLWLGLFRIRTALLAAPVLLLAAYVMVFTVSRGGVLALAVVALILGGGAVRVAWETGRRSLGLLAIAFLVAVVVLLGAGATGGFLQQRFAQSAKDWATRVDHWSLGLRMADDSWPGRIFGTGLGTFPRRYLEKGPADRQAATFAYVEDADPASGRGTHLRLGIGETLYVAQRIAVESGGTYRLSIDVRSKAPEARVATPICEKQLLNSRRCEWIDVEIPNDGAWHTVSRGVALKTVAKGAWWQHLPVELYFYYPGKSGVVDIDNVRLLDSGGANRIANGDFLSGGDRWFFKTHSHLPWHLKSLWVHAVFEMGVAGAVLLGLLVVCAYVRLVPMAWRGSRLAWVLLASISGLLIVGVFDSLIDAPRIAALLVGFLFLGASLRSGSTIGANA